MSPSPWKVSVISTGYDMPDIRADLRDLLTSKGFHLLAYEDIGYPVQPHVHSHEACVIALDPADIVILVIDKRYGGLYLGVGDISITEKEYTTAVKKDKIIIPCIRRAAWDERHQVYGSAAQLAKAKKGLEPRKTLKPQYVDSWETLDFIERVRKADRDNYVIIFDDMVDLRKKVVGRLEGLSQWLLQEVVKKQMQAVRNIKTTTGMAFSLGDVLQKGYFVEPPYILKSGPKEWAKRLSRIITGVRREGKCVAVIADPGSGKSTILGKAYLEHARRSVRERSSKLPFFVALRGRGQFAFDVPEYIAECFRQLMQKDSYPYLVLTNLSPTFYLDGLDEMTDQKAGFDTQRFCESTMFAHPFMLSCRTRFAQNVLYDPPIANRFTAFVELSPWKRSIASKYTRAFCRNRHRRDLISVFLAAFAAEPGMTEISANPLLLTLFLCIVEDAGMKVPLDVHNKSQLLSRTLRIWAKRELGRLNTRGGATPDEEKDLLRAWQVASWFLYRSRLTATAPPKISALLSEIREILPDPAAVCEKDAFAGLFEIQNHTDEVTGLIHEQLMEQLVGEMLYEGMKTGGYPFPDSLSVPVRWEINQLVQSMLSDAPSQTLQEMLVNLARAYQEALNEIGTAAIVRRNQSAYYMGRLDIPEAVAQLRKFMAEEPDPSVQLSIGFGLTKRGQFDVEEYVVTRLREDPEWDEANRGYHLFYYHDSHTAHQHPPYEDSVSSQWKRTLEALVRHIKSPRVTHICIRRIELLTIRRFVDTRRSKGPLTSATMDSIGQAVAATVQNPSLPVPKEYLQKLAAEWGELKAAWTRVP